MSWLIPLAEEQTKDVSGVHWNLIFLCAFVLAAIVALIWWLRR